MDRKKLFDDEDEAVDLGRFFLYLTSVDYNPGQNAYGGESSGYYGGAQQNYGQPAEYNQYSGDYSGVIILFLTCLKFGGQYENTNYQQQQ